MDSSCQLKLPNACIISNVHANKTDGGSISDPREYRDISQIRYEYYWGWTRFYDKARRIFVADGRYIYFQKDPFALLPKNDMLPFQRTIQVYYEDSNAKLRNEKWNSIWI
jgi:hypothetical protein